MINYNVGEQYIVIPIKEARTQWNTPPGFTKNMQQYCDEIVTIKYIWDSDKVLIKEDRGTYMWNTSWLRPIFIND